MSAQQPENPKETEDWEKQKQSEERQSKEDTQETAKWESEKDEEERRGDL
jgi:hypothetical protein